MSIRENFGKLARKISLSRGKKVVGEIKEHFSEKEITTQMDEFGRVVYYFNGQRVPDGERGTKELHVIFLEDGNYYNKNNGAKMTINELKRIDDWIIYCNENAQKSGITNAIGGANEVNRVNKIIKLVNSLSEIEDEKAYIKTRREIFLKVADLEMQTKKEPEKVTVKNPLLTKIGGGTDGLSL